MSTKNVHAAQGTSEQQQSGPLASKLKAQQAWQRLWMRIQSITPSGLLRFLLVVIALAGLLWLIASTFQSLAAFVIGIMLAYITLPVVNWLNRFLPRGLAVLLVILGEIALVALFFALLIPAVIQQLLRFLQTLPTTDQLRASFTQLAQQTQSWPQPVRVFLRGWLQQSTVNLQHNFTQYILGLVSLGARSILGLLSAFSFVLSLLVILVIASQFGLIWLFLGAPLAQIVFDLYRYVYGRLSDPPRPAGILPGESVPTTREPRGTNRRTMVPFSERTTFQGNTPLPPEKVS